MTTRATTAKSKAKHKNGASSFSGVIDGAEALVAATADIGEDKLEGLRTSLQAELEAAREHLTSLETNLKDRASSVDEYVHENPWQAVGIAAAAGFVAGAIAFRR